MKMLHRSFSKLVLKMYFSNQVRIRKGIIIHVNPPGSSGSLPEMQPNSRTPGNETEPPGCENTKKKKKKKKIFFFFFFFFSRPSFLRMYGYNGHLLLEGN